MEAINKPLVETDITFDDHLIAEMVELAGGRPCYLQKLAYFAFDASAGGRIREGVRIRGIRRHAGARWPRCLRQGFQAFVPLPG